MNDVRILNHTVWECKYHIVWIPKYRKKVLYGQIRKHLGDIFRGLARQKESEVVEGHLMLDHVHMLISVPPKYAVAQVVGFIKGKSAIHIARGFMGGIGILPGNTFGPEVTLCRQSVRMRRLSRNTSRNRKKRIEDSIS